MVRDADVVVVIDATLTAAERQVARQVALGAGKRAGRVALVVFGDHQDCPVGPGKPPVKNELEASGFLEGRKAADRWLQQHFQPIEHDYLDSALECAIAAAADLQWRPEAPKLALLMGSSLPHNSPGSRLPLRTGVDCPRHRCWRTELERLKRLPAMVIRVATPAIGEPEPNDFANLLRLEVWKALNGGRRPEVLETALPARWADQIR